jgi:hypothetical protein
MQIGGKHILNNLSEMNTNSKYWYLFTFSFVVILGGGILIIELLKNSVYDLVERKTLLKEEILKIRPSHGSCYIELTNERKVLMPQSKNYFYSPPGFSELASIGDSLVKDTNSDTVYLIKSNTKLIFRVGSALNLPEKAPN